MSAEARSDNPDRFFCKIGLRLGDNPDTNHEMVSRHEPLFVDQAFTLIDGGPSVGWTPFTHHHSASPPPFLASNASRRGHFNNSSPPPLLQK